MAQYYFPLHITDNQNEPIYGLVNSDSNLSQTSGGFGSTGGLANTNSGDGSTREKVYRVVTGTSRQYIFTNITGTDVDLVARFRSNNNTNITKDFGLIVRGSIAQANSNVMNGYAVRVGSLAGTYRELQYFNWTGTNTQTTSTITTTPNHYRALTDASDVATTYRYLRLNATGTTITMYGWWEGDEETLQQKNQTITDSTYSSGYVGMFFENSSLVDIDFLAIGTGTDNAPLTADSRELNAIVYQPQQAGNSTIPALGYDVRAYYLATGSPVGYGVSSLTDGTVSIQQLKFGERLCILNAVDLDNNPQKWRRALSGPVTPTLSV